MVEVLLSSDRILVVDVLDLTAMVNHCIQKNNFQVCLVIYRKLHIIDNSIILKKLNFMTPTIPNFINYFSNS